MGDACEAQRASLRDQLVDRAAQATRETPPWYRYASVLDFVVRHGRAFEARPFTFEERLYVRSCVERAGFRPRMGHCFGNSRRALVLGDTEQRLTYVEGYLTTKFFILHHGWLAWDGRIVDVTLDAANFGLKLSMPRAERTRGGPPDRYTHVATDYFGVEFPRSRVLESNWRSTFGLIEYAPKYKPRTLRDPWVERRSESDG